MYQLFTPPQGIVAITIEFSLDNAELLCVFSKGFLR